MQKIGVLPIEGFALMSFACCVETLRAANVLSGTNLYETIIIGDEYDSVESAAPAQAKADARIGDTLDLDYLFVIAAGQPERYDNPKLTRWLARLDRQGVNIGGVSGGPVILARSGLMQGRRMTVHWEHTPALAEEFPELLLERSLFTIDRNRITCAGGAAALDMMYALIEQHHGAKFAGRVSDWLLHADIRPPSGPQRRSLIERVETTNAAVLAAVNAMENHIAEPLSLDQLAIISCISSRQLNRLFKEKTGLTTGTYYRDIRLAKAKSLLEGSTLRLTEIALATGFGSSSHFAQNFRKKFGCKPSDVRKPKHLSQRTN